MKTTMRIDGLRELDAALGQLPKAAAKGVLRRVGIKALQPMADTARQLAPDDPATGGNDLKNSITVGTRLNIRQTRLKKKRDDKSFQEVYMGPTVGHGLLQEFGTVSHAPQPFMRPAFSQHAEETIKIVAAELGDEIHKTAARRARSAAKKAARAG